jgi:hypothetical protein
MIRSRAGRCAHLDRRRQELAPLIKFARIGRPISSSFVLLSERIAQRRRAPQTAYSSTWPEKLLPASQICSLIFCVRLKRLAATIERRRRERKRVSEVPDIQCWRRRALERLNSLARLGPGATGSSTFYGGQEQDCKSDLDSQIALSYASPLLFGQLDALCVCRALLNSSLKGDSPSWLAVGLFAWRWWLGV